MRPSSWPETELEPPCCSASAAIAGSKACPDSHLHRATSAEASKTRRRSNAAQTTDALVTNRVSCFTPLGISLTTGVFESGIGKVGGAPYGASCRRPNTDQAGQSVLDILVHVFGRTG